MRVPERRKPRLAGFDTFLPLLAVPVAVVGLIVVLTEIVIRMGHQGAVPSAAWGGFEDVRQVSRQDFWKALLFGLGAVTAAWLTWHFHRQTGTYTRLRFTGNWGKRALTGVGWLLVKALFLALMGFLALFIVVPVVIGLAGMGLLLGQREATFVQRLVSDAALLLGLSTAVVGLTAFSRAFWLWSALRHVVLLPSAPGGAPPEGLVEIRGIARAPVEHKPVLARGSVGPFYLETAGGRIRVEPPEEFDIEGGQAFLPDDGFGNFILRAGEPALAVGRLERGGREPSLRPCPAPRGSLIFTGRKRFFSIPNLFLIAHGDEAAAKRRLARKHLLWIGIASVLTIGGALVALIGLAARLDPEFVRTLAIGGGGR